MATVTDKLCYLSAALDKYSYSYWSSHMTLSGQEINSFRETDFDGNYSRYTDLLKILQHEKFTKRESYFYLRTDKSDDAETCFSVSKTSSPPASPFFQNRYLCSRDAVVLRILVFYGVNSTSQADVVLTFWVKVKISRCRHKSTLGDPVG